jgi:hypothetical protein
MDKVREALETARQFISDELHNRNHGFCCDEGEDYTARPRRIMDGLSAALASLPASDAGGWRPIETAENFDRVIVAGWQPRNGNTAGYWWYHEDCTDECGRPMDHPDALLWHPFPAVPSAPPAPPRSLPTGGADA